MKTFAYDTSTLQKIFVADLEPLKKGSKFSYLGTKYTVKGQVTITGEQFINVKELDK